MDDYFDIKAYSFSALKNIVPPKTPAHFRKYIEEGIEQTEAMKEGSATHTLLLEPDEFENRYILFESSYNDFRSKAAREERDSFIAKHPDREVIIGREMWENLFLRRQKVWQHKTALWLLSQRESIKEQGITWQDQETGVDMKAKPDIIVTNEIMADVKTMQAIDDFHLEKNIRDGLMYMQAAIYIDGVKAVYNFDIKRYYIIAIEKDTNLVRCEFLSRYDIDYGREIYRRAIIRAEDARLQDNYYGYQQRNIEPFFLNTYHIDRVLSEF